MNNKNQQEQLRQWTRLGYIIHQQQMSKDFQKQVLDEYFRQNQKLDPYVFVTPEVNQFIQMTNMFVTGKFLLSFMVANTIVAPLQTMVTSLQLSVAKHKDIYQSPEAKSKELAKLNTEMTVHDRRKFQLMIRAGGKTIPYTAPVYGGYKQTFQGLKSQGFLGFYKGLFFRNLATAIFFTPFFYHSTLIDEREIKQGLLFQDIKLISYCLLLDTFINPIHALEKRYVLQNRIPQFRVIKSPYKAIQKMMRTGEATKGLSFHLINNAVGFFTRFPLYFQLIAGQGVHPALYGAYTLGELVTYPFSTAYKRLQCQTQRYAGMIPVRYSNLIHAVKVIGYEEGVKGLWRAFPLHIASNFLKLKLIQLFTLVPLQKQ